jgi:hypothetical protein
MRTEAFPETRDANGRKYRDGERSLSLPGRGGFSNAGRNAMRFILCTRKFDGQSRCAPCGESLRYAARGPAREIRSGGWQERNVRVTPFMPTILFSPSPTLRGRGWRFIDELRHSVRTRLSLLLVAIVVMVPAFAGANPGSGQGKVFLFASPNTQESLPDQDARARLTSPEQISATAFADRAACALTHSVQIADSLGIYDKSSENSYVLETDLGRKQSEYLAALLGLSSRQKFVLLFLEDAAGPDRLWTIVTSQSLDTVVAALRRLMLTPVTVRPETGQNEIWFVDPGGKHSRDLNLFRAKVSGRVHVASGAAEMLGHEDRGTAMKRWQQQISGFQEQSGLSLFDQVTRNAARNGAAVHTCSREIPHAY